MDLYGILDGFGDCFGINKFLPYELHLVWYSHLIKFLLGTVMSIYLYIFCHYCKIAELDKCNIAHMAFKTKYTYFLGLSFCQLLDLLDCGKVGNCSRRFRKSNSWVYYAGSPALSPCKWFSFLPFHCSWKVWLALVCAHCSPWVYVLIVYNWFRIGFLSLSLFPKY